MKELQASTSPHTPTPFSHTAALRHCHLWMLPQEHYEAAVEKMGLAKDRVVHVSHL